VADDVQLADLGKLRRPVSEELGRDGIGTLSGRNIALRQ
jgi:hypothetical protein